MFLRLVGVGVIKGLAIEGDRKLDRPQPVGGEQALVDIPLDVLTHKVDLEVVALGKKGHCPIRIAQGPGRAPEGASC